MRRRAAPVEEKNRHLLIGLAADIPRPVYPVGGLIPIGEARLDFDPESAPPIPELEREGVSDRSRAELFENLSDIEFLAGDLDASEAAARETLRLAGPSGGVGAWALLGLAGIAGTRREPEEVVRLCREALERIDDVEEARRPGFRVDVATVLIEAGLREEARETYMQVSEEARRRGDPLLVAYAEASVSWLDLIELRFGAAEAGFRSVLEMHRGLGHAIWEADAHRGLGLARLGLGRRAEARTDLVTSLELPAADPNQSIELIEALVWNALAAEPGDARSAARLLGAVAAVLAARALIAAGAVAGPPAAATAVAAAAEDEDTRVHARDRGDVRNRSCARHDAMVAQRATESIPAVTQQCAGMAQPMMG